MRYFYFFIISLLTSTSISAQNHHTRFEAIDVKHYRFEIAVNDSNNIIYGQAEISILFKKNAAFFELDLIQKNQENGFGMLVESIIEDGKELQFNHQKNKLKIYSSTQANEQKSFIIKYFGIPEDGLIISNNKFGDRVFFGDNWPNRARYWLPCVDHPSDKASLEFIVNAPAHYQVVSNGLCIEETNSGDYTLSHWKTDIPLSTKLMVIGIGQFAKQNLVNYKPVDISSWVYPQNKMEGFSDYEIAIKPVEFYSSNIAPFPFEKLANVQSKTIYGGMENAGCIFYSERSVTGKNDQERLFAHEIAHQWFGDAISEQDWHHVWISEGFATYFTGLYIENQYGKKAFQDWLIQQKEKVVRYSKHKMAPVVDSTQKVNVGLLSANSYQKGAWFLHMLRKELGDDLFWKSIRIYYQKYAYKNVLTEDFQKVIEEESGNDYATFFNQWLYVAGHPLLSSAWTIQGRKLQVQLTQHQEQFIFEFPIEIKIEYEDGSSSIKTLKVNKAKQLFKIKSKKSPVRIILDPDHWLLFEETENQ